jgi:hypothetical protein
MGNNIYDVGDLVRITATFQLDNGTLVDPTSVTFQYKKDTETKVTKVYGIDSGVTRDSLGVYYNDIDCVESGLWLYRVYSTGNGQAAAEGKFTVRASAFDD